MIGLEGGIVVPLNLLGMFFPTGDWLGYGNMLQALITLILCVAGIKYSLSLTTRLIAQSASRSKTDEKVSAHRGGLLGVAKS